MNLTFSTHSTAMDLVDIDFAGLFPDIHDHLEMRYVLHLCGIRDIPSQTRLIEYEGIELVESLADYDDQEIDKMADRNSKRTPAATRIQFGKDKGSKSDFALGPQEEPRRSRV